MDGIIIGIGLTFILHELFYIWIDDEIVPNSKPFNCSFCLSFWVSFGLFLLSLDVVTLYATFENWRIDIPVWTLDMNPFLFTIPIGYRIVNKIINRL